MARKRNNNTRDGGSRYYANRLPDLGSLFHPNVKFLEDRREWHPMRSLRPAAALQRGSRRLVIARKRSKVLPHKLQFAIPKQVAVCVRRKERREVILAMGKGGGGKRKPPRRNLWSAVKC